MSKHNCSIKIGLLGIILASLVGCNSGQKEISSCSTIDLRIRQSERRSLGEEILVNSSVTPEKEKIVENFSNCNFEIAEQQLKLKARLNDPEAWIYHNNAKALNANKQPLKIVASVPINTNSNIAQEILRGVALAQHEFNEDNNNDKRLLLVEIADDENQPYIVKQLASEFVKDSSILAVVGHNSSTASLSAVPVYHQGGLVMVSPTSTTTNLLAISKYVFRTVFSNHELAKVLSEHINNESLKKIAICVDPSSAYSQSFKTDLKYFMKEKIVDIECDLEPEKLDLNPQKIVNQISNKVDGIIIIPSVNTVAKAIEIAEEVAKKNTKRDKKIRLFSTESMYQPDTLKEGGNNVEEMVLVVPWHRDLKKEFQTKNKQLFDTGNINWRTAMAYDATQVIIEGLKKATTREELQEVLANPNFAVEGVTETIKFDESGEPQGKPILVVIRQNAFELLK
ncbi:MAG: ABC transporter substrate-binding protein [Crocosphaera sp.]